MPPGLPRNIGTHNIQGGTSTQLCIFCQLANRNTRLGKVRQPGTRRLQSTLPGSRGLHAGTPAKRPPADTPRSAWPAQQPAFDESALNAFLKSRKAAGPPAAQPKPNLFRPAPEELGKWGKPGQLNPNAPLRSPPIFQATSKEQDIFSRPLVPPKPPKPPTTKQQSSAPKLGFNPFEDILKSKRSAMDIEDDLFKGMPAEEPPQPTPWKPSIEGIFSNLKPSAQASTDPLKPKSYTQFSKPFQLSSTSIRDSLKSLQQTPQQTEPPKKPIANFGFMSANTRQPTPSDSPPSLPPQKTTPTPHADIVPLATEDGHIRIDTSTWRSSSRETWDYEVDPQKEIEREAERLLAEDLARGETRSRAEQEVAREHEEQIKRADMAKIVARARGAMFKVGLKDLALWEPERQREEASPLEITVRKDLYIPPSVSVSNFAGLLKVPLVTLQRKMELLGLEKQECQADHVLDAEMATLIAPEFGYEPHVDEVAAFDLFPQSIPTDTNLPLRPPIVTIMGHVDHGKTTLLDTLRKSAVAASEAGGITQHIGAFSVALSSGEQICFLDTPGHAAFLTMRERGANVTDIIVLVVAADDGVMPQTQEALQHARNAGVPIIVAINKCDLENADPDAVKSKLLEEGLELEEFGGNVQCVEVSGKTGEGLQDLEAAIVTLSEVLEVKAPKDGPSEGWIIESTVHPGRGTYATVLVKSGTLKLGDYIVGGCTYAKVRRMTTADGKSVKLAPPGTAVEVSGWKGRPDAGDQVLQAAKESDAKLVVRNRLVQRESKRDQKTIELINERRLAAKRELYQEREKKMVAAEVKRTGKTLPGILKDSGTEEGEKKGPTMVRFLVKADVGGSAEAVEEAIKDLGNEEVKVEVVDTSVGEITESDITVAAASNAKILGFNIKALNPSLRPIVHQNNIEIFYHSIIYKLIDDVVARLESMLTPIIELTVVGEAELVQLFDIKLKTHGNKKEKQIGGCKVTNGYISLKEKCRITRNGRIVFTGFLDTLKHFKEDVKEVRKGTECGLSFEEFENLQVGDLIQCYREIEVPRKLW